MERASTMSELEGAQRPAQPIEAPPAARAAARTPAFANLEFMMSLLGDGPSAAPPSRLALGAHPLVRSALHHRPRAGAPEGEPLDLLGQREVPLGDPARRVGLELDPDLPPGDLEVGMVIGRLAQKADRIDQHQCGRPPVGAEFAAYP